MEPIALTAQEIEHLQTMLYSSDASNCLLALHLLEQQSTIPPELLSAILGVYTYYNKQEAYSKLARKILNKKGKKKLVKFLRNTPKKGFETWTVYQWEEYTNQLEEETPLPALPLVTFWYQQVPNDPRYLKLYTATIAQLPSAQRQEKARAECSPRVQGSTVYVKPADGLLLEDLVAWQNIRQVIADPHWAVFNLIFKHLRLVHTFTLQGVAEYPRNADILLPNGFEQLQNLQTLELLHITSVSKKAWRIIKQLPRLKKIVITLGEQAKEYIGYYFFTLVTVEELHISGQYLALDIALHKLPNLKRLYISNSTLKDSAVFFEALGQLEHLEQVHFHPELQAAYEGYLKNIF
jgi:Leucine-rich repeat (LRR) protein